MIHSGVIKLEPTGSRCALVYGQMNEPPGARARVGLTGLTVAEYFRDEEGQDVLLFVDNIFRFTQACSEVSALLGRIPSAVGYQPTLATDLVYNLSHFREPYRKELRQLKKDQLHQFKQSSYQQTILLILPQPQLSHILTLRPFYPEP